MILDWVGGWLFYLFAGLRTGLLLVTHMPPAVIVYDGLEVRDGDDVKRCTFTGLKVCVQDWGDWWHDPGDGRGDFCGQSPPEPCR